MNKILHALFTAVTAATGLAAQAQQFPLPPKAQAILAAVSATAVAISAWVAASPVKPAPARP